MNMYYVISVANMGNVQYFSKKQALKAFSDLAEMTLEYSGSRAVGESVTLFCNDEIIRETDGFWHIEVTDTYAGEANYSWVRKYVMPCVCQESRKTIVTKAKALAAYTGVKCETVWYPDQAIIRPRNACVQISITWSDKP